jgi:hypothetical protein
MDPAGTKNDGGVVFGSQVVTINSVAYVAENIDFDDPSKNIVRTNENGVPDGQVFIDDVASGSATLQLASASTVAPPKYAEFSITPVGGAAAITFIVTQVGQRYQSAGETKIPIQFRKKLAAAPAP